MKATDQNKYRNWLISQTETSPKRIEQFRFLLERLWDKEFYTVLPQDENRSRDGVLLRETYAAETKAPLDWYYGTMNGPSRCLEVLLGLAKRAQYEVYATEKSPDADHFFWEFIGNLGLDKFSKENWSSEAYFQIDNILTVWMERTYGENGQGGVFPLKNAAEDQRKIELWYQMQAYLSEANYV